MALVTFIVKLHINNRVKFKTIEVPVLSQFTFGHLIASLREMAPQLNVDDLTWKEDIQGDLVDLTNDFELTEAFKYMESNLINGRRILTIFGNSGLPQNHNDAAPLPVAVGSTNTNQVAGIVHQTPQVADDSLLVLVKQEPILQPSVPQPATEPLDDSAPQNPIAESVPTILMIGAEAQIGTSAAVRSPVTIKTEVLDDSTNVLQYGVDLPETNALSGASSDVSIRIKSIESLASGSSGAVSGRSTGLGVGEQQAAGLIGTQNADDVDSGLPSDEELLRGGMVGVVSRKPRIIDPSGRQLLQGTSSIRLPQTFSGRHCRFCDKRIGHPAKLKYHEQSQCPLRPQMDSTTSDLKELVPEAVRKMLVKSSLTQKTRRVGSSSRPQGGLAKRRRMSFGHSSPPAAEFELPGDDEGRTSSAAARVDQASAVNDLEIKREQLSRNSNHADGVREIKQEPDSAGFAKSCFQPPHLPEDQKIADTTLEDNTRLKIGARVLAHGFKSDRNYYAACIESHELNGYKVYFADETGSHLVNRSRVIPLVQFVQNKNVSVRFVKSAADDDEWFSARITEAPDPNDAFHWFMGSFTLVDKSSGYSFSASWRDLVVEPDDLDQFAREPSSDCAGVSKCNIIWDERPKKRLSFGRKAHETGASPLNISLTTVDKPNPPKRCPRKSASRKTKKVENECYRCGKIGKLMICSRGDCPKVYHLECLGQTNFRGRFHCPWHFCDICDDAKKSITLCSRCDNSWCAAHANGKYVGLFEGKFVCYRELDFATADKTVFLPRDPTKPSCVFNNEEKPRSIHFSNLGARAHHAAGVRGSSAERDEYLKNCGDDLPTTSSGSSCSAEEIVPARFTLPGGSRN